MEKLKRFKVIFDIVIRPSEKREMKEKDYIVEVFEEANLEFEDGTIKSMKITEIK